MEITNYGKTVKLLAYIEEFINAKIEYEFNSRQDSHEHITTHENINRTRTALIDYIEEWVNTCG